MLCFECDETADVRHHVVPVCRGGQRTVPLCHICHAKAHGILLRHLADRQTTPEIIEQIRNYRLQGRSFTEVAKLMNMRQQRVSKICKTHNLHYPGYRPRGSGPAIPYRSKGVTVSL